MFDPHNGLAYTLIPTHDAALSRLVKQTEFTTLLLRREGRESPQSLLRMEILRVLKESPNSDFEDRLVMHGEITALTSEINSSSLLLLS